jgi:hypothetical protein
MKTAATGSSVTGCDILLMNHEQCVKTSIIERHNRYDVLCPFSLFTMSPSRTHKTLAIQGN